MENLTIVKDKYYATCSGDCELIQDMLNRTEEEERFLQESKYRSYLKEKEALGIIDSRKDPFNYIVKNNWVKLIYIIKNWFNK